MSVIQRLKSDDRGAAAILFALSVVPLLAFAGAAIDYSRAATARTSLQNRLDSAVLAGVNKDSGKVEAAQAMFAEAALPAGTQILNSQFNVDGDTLNGEITATVQTTLLNVIGIHSVQVSVESAALLDVTSGTPGDPGEDIVTEVVTPGSPVCILVKNPSANQALLVNSGVKITAPTCEMHVRSTANTAAMMNSTQNINMQRVCIKSDSITQNGTQNPVVQKNCPAIDDPYAGTLPTVSVPNNNCSTKNGYSYNASPNTLTLPAGNYCGLNFNSGFKTVSIGAGNFTGINFSGIETLNLSPGLYENINFNSGIKQVNFAPGLYIWKSSTNLNSGIKFVGQGVTFYYPNSSSYIQVNSGASLNLSAPASGTYAGILFFEPVGLGASSFAVNGNADHRLEGLIYWPSRSVTFNSTSTIQADKIALVVDKLILNNIDWKFGPPESKGMNLPPTVTIVRTPGTPTPGTPDAKSARLVK